MGKVALYLTTRSLNMTLNANEWGRQPKLGTYLLRNAQIIEKLKMVNYMGSDLGDLKIN